MNSKLLRTATGLAASAAAATALVAPAAATPDDTHFDALVFSKTAAFRHSSIPTGVAAIEELGQRHGFDVDATEDAGAFTDENLAKYDVVVWLSTTGDVLDDEQQAAFERYIENGGGYAGVHAASDTEYDWPWYGGLVGSYFNGHPAQQTATVKVAGRGNPSTAGLPNRWQRFDEWYNFRGNPRDAVRVLATLDEKTYDAGPTAMGDDHPIAWCHPYDGGRAWYTGMGHTEASYSEDLFLSHLLGGIQQAAGVAKFNCGTDEDAE
jgi:type 1 glutamine amidotransferase